MNADQFRTELLVEQFGHTTPEHRHADGPDRHIADTDHDLAVAARRRELIQLPADGERAYQQVKNRGQRAKAAA
jgi:hypothetical protein